MLPAMLLAMLSRVIVCDVVFFLQNRKILKKKNLLLSKGCVIIIERDCTRYAMKQEVAATGGEFLPSMSDFKPDDKKYR